MGTLNSTFDLYTAGTSEKHCEDCGDTDDLAPLGSGSFGAQMWICQDCAVKSHRELQARIDAAMNDTAAWAAMDEWEEA